VSQLLPERRSRIAPGRWEPFSELEQVSERMRRLLEQTFSDFGARAETGGWTPLVDIEETEDAYVVDAELPGVKREDVQIEIVGSELTITGQNEERERKGAMRRQTRRTGRFDYRVGLPEAVDPEKVEANLKDGVLSVRIPKSQRAQRRKIEVKA
jgi:HSP20 family protein